MCGGVHRADEPTTKQPEPTTHNTQHTTRNACTFLVRRCVHASINDMLVRRTRCQGGAGAAGSKDAVSWVACAVVAAAAVILSALARRGNPIRVESKPKQRRD